MKSRDVEGAITVYLTLVLFLVLSLVLVSLESARQQATVALAQMNFTQALQSTLGEYYAPLYEEYSLYGLYDVDPKGQAEYYMEATANPAKELPAFYVGSKESSYSYAYEIAEVAITSVKRLTAGGGALCRLQMTEAGVCLGVEALAEELLDAVHLLEDSETTMHVMQEKMAIEEQLTQVDKLLIELMPLLDGIATEEDGVVFADGGKLRIESTFVKQLVPGDITQTSVGINNEDFFRQLKPYYVDGVDCATRILQLAESGNKENRETVLQQMMGQQARLRGVITGTLGKTEAALECIRKIQVITTKAVPLVDAYERLLKSLDAVLEPNTIKDLRTDLEQMKRYVGTSEDVIGYHFDGMIETLEQNRDILLRIQEKFVVSIEGTEDIQWKQAYEEISSLFEEYSLKYLTIDYSNIRKATTTEVSLLETVKNYVLDGLGSGLLSDDVVLSTRSIWGKTLPSDTMSGEENDLFVYGADEKGTKLSLETVRNFFNGEGLSDLLDWLAAGVEAMAEKILLIVYLEENFSNFSEKEAKGALHYEQEYLLFGHKVDRSNVQAATLAILGIRIVLNMVHTFTDTSKNLQATELATGLLGAFGMPFLITACKYVILFAWGLQNAQLETAAILQGREVPFWVSSTSFRVKLSEIFTMNKDARMARCSSYQIAESGAFNYQYYLLLFLLLSDEDSLTVRAMDLIQCNLQLYYDPEFRMEDCYYSFGGKAVVRVPTLYTAISFGGYAPQRNRFYEITVRGAASY